MSSIDDAKEFAEQAEKYRAPKEGSKITKDEATPSDSDDKRAGAVCQLAAVGALLALAAAVVFAYVLFTGEHTPTETVNGGWFIPPVAAIIIPLTLVPLLPHPSTSTGRLLLLLGYGTFGLGLLLFLLIAAMLFARLVSHPSRPRR